MQEIPERVGNSDDDGPIGLEIVNLFAHESLIPEFLGLGGTAFAVRPAPAL